MISAESAHVVLQRVIDIEPLPEVAQFERWVSATLAVVPESSPDSQVTIRIVDQGESAALNQQYRGKDGPTNVLSFPFSAPDDLKGHELGDLIICARTVSDEALEQGKILTDHWAHLTVHGLLHLLGYDHQSGDDAKKMESIERNILASMAIDDPYS